MKYCYEKSCNCKGGLIIDVERVVGIVGPQGPMGTQGRGLQIDGVVQSESQLPTQGLKNGLVYVVKESDPQNSLFVYDETAKKWENIGPLEGSTPQIAENGDWFIDGEDTGIKAVGSDGVTPHIGESGNWFIGEDDTGVSAQGVAGEKGEQGEKGDKGDKGDAGERGDKGETGENGITPRIGDNGNWFIGDVDTGISSLGQKGDKGDTGERGPRGFQGEQGERGPTGPEVIRACNMVTTNDPSFPMPAVGLEIASNGRLPIKRAEIDTGGFCTLDPDDYTIQFNTIGTFEVMFSINGYVKNTSTTFDPSSDFVCVGFRAANMPNIYIGANSWSFQDVPQNTVGFGILQVESIVDPYELINLQRKPLYLCGGTLRQTTSGSYFVCPAVQIIIKKIR